MLTEIPRYELHLAAPSTNTHGTRGRNNHDERKLAERHLQHQSRSSRKISFRAFDPRRYRERIMRFSLTGLERLPLRNR